MEFGSFTITQLISFGLISLGLTAFSRRSLGNPDCHGFYRYFSFECIAALIVINAPYWHQYDISLFGILSWILLFGSALLVVSGFYLLRTRGGHRDSQINSENLMFENTSVLVSTGIYRHIRHPMYSSLLLLNYGALLKHISILSLFLALLGTLFLLLAALSEERENLEYFGDHYRDYMKRSKRFLPGLF